MRFLYKPDEGKKDFFEKPDLDAAMRRLEHKHRVFDVSLTSKAYDGPWAVWRKLTGKPEHIGTLIKLKDKGSGDE